MEKKNYKRPIMQIEEFVANHFIAACSEVQTMVTYDFWCNANVGEYVWFETNGKAGLQAKTDRRGNGVWNTTDDDYDQTWASREGKWGSFGPCGHSHSVTVPKGTPIDDIFPKGYASYYSNGYNATQVRIYTDGDTNTHVTRQLNESEFTPKPTHS